MYFFLNCPLHYEFRACGLTAHLPAEYLPVHSHHTGSHSADPSMRLLLLSFYWGLVPLPMLSFLFVFFLSGQIINSVPETLAKLGGWIFWWFNRSLDGRKRQRIRDINPRTTTEGMFTGGVRVERVMAGPVIVIVLLIRVNYYYNSLSPHKRWHIVLNLQFSPAPQLPTISILLLYITTNSPEEGPD